MGSAHQYAPFGSPLLTPAFGSGSGSPATFFTPAASVIPHAVNAAPDSTIAFGGIPHGTPATAFGTPASAFGTPLSAFGSPAFHTPAATLGGLPFGTSSSRGQAFGTPTPAFGSPAAFPPQQPDAAPAAMTPGPDDTEDHFAAGPFGAAAFGSKSRSCVFW